MSSAGLWMVMKVYDDLVHVRSICGASIRRMFFIAER